jgi:cellulose synthase operon protein YhjQ
MSVPSDISNLFKLFGGSADWYQELSRAPRPAPAQPRWPTLASVAAASVPSPGEAPAAQAVEQLLQADEPPVALVRAQDEHALWTSQGLQSLLAARGAETSSGAPQPGGTRANLQHIRVIAVVSAKGGVGKSTMAANLAVTFAKAGSAVLALDLDPQNGLRQHFRADAQSTCPASAGLASAEGALAQQCLHSEDAVQVLPYGVVDEHRRRAFEHDLAADPAWLGKQLAALQLTKGTVVLIDTPPGPSVYLQQALSVANLALVVSLADAASYTALPLIENLVATYTQDTADFMGSSYLINQVDHSRKLNQDITQIMQGLLGTRLAGLVHADEAIGEALAYNRNVLEYAPQGRACQDILSCAQTLVERLAAHSRGEQTE